MNSAQRAVIAAARKEGLEPMEVAAELMNHDITEVVLGFMRKREVAFNKLSEKEQDAVIAELGSELKKITATACRVINSNGVETVAATLKSLKIDGKLTATMVIDGEEPNRHVLTDKAHDKSSILIVLYPNNYSDGMSAHQGEKDQKPLPLDGEQPDESKSKGNAPAKTESPSSAKAIAAKPVEVPPKLLADAIEFIGRHQVCATASLQNHLKIATKKAEAVQAKLAELGHIELDDSGVYQIVRRRPEQVDLAEEGGSSKDVLTFDGDDEKSEETPRAMTEDLYADIKAKVILDGRVSVGALAITFDIETDLVDSAIQQLVADGVIGEEDEETGVREVLVKND